ncbi:hypothetical protein I317_04688 [Kwoniella heveanensis CBS 569]|nr:hypothetical protein I317_04688 [Kwoniella heveanensis CBS 569]
MTTIPAGDYDLNPSSALLSEWGVTKKRRRDADQLVALRYAFKPASVAQDTPGTYYPDAGIGSNGQVVFDVNGGSQQVFDVREEHGKGRECVLIFDEDTQSFTLHTLPSTLHLTLNRSASAPNARRPPSTISSTSSSSNPLSRSTRTRAGGIATTSIDDEHEHTSASSSRSREASIGGVGGEDSYVIGTEEANDDTPRPKKKSRPSEVPLNSVTASSRPTGAGTGAGAGASRATKGGKGLPRKKPLESAPIPVLSAPPAAKAKAGGKKGTKAKAGTAKSVPPSRSTAAKGGKKASFATSTANASSAASTSGGAKFKSAEYIEDSDEEIAQSDAAQAPAEEEEVDEFANLLGESLAQGDAYAEEESDDDEDDDDDEEDEEDDALGGARLVVSGQGNSGAGGRGQVNSTLNRSGPGTGPGEYCISQSVRRLTS